ALTQIAAITALAHMDALLDTVEAIKRDRDHLVAALREDGFTVADSDTNFVLFGGLADEQATWRALLDRGVLIRDVGLPGWLRVAVGPPEENATFLDAIRAVAG